MPPKKGVTKSRAAKEKKPKAKKDPNAPKKPSGAYIWFCNENRAKIKQENESWGVAEIGKALGKLWSELDEPKKQKFFKRAEEDKVRYQKELEEYNAKKADEDAAAADEDDEEKEDKKKKKKKKDEQDEDDE